LVAAVLTVVVTIQAQALLHRFGGWVITVAMVLAMAGIASSAFWATRFLFVRIIRARCPHCGASATYEPARREYRCAGCAAVESAEWDPKALAGGMAFIGGGLGIMVFCAALVISDKADFGLFAFSLLFGAPFVLAGLLALGLPEHLPFFRRTADRIDWTMAFAGAIGVLMGTILLLAMAGSAASSFRVHPWIALAAGACFPIAGLMVLLMSRRATNQERVFGVLGVVLLTLMAVTAWGVALGASGVEQVLVGLGAAVALVVALYQWYGFVKRWRHSRSQ
jgi:hypothetical protein